MKYKKHKQDRKMEETPGRATEEGSVSQDGQTKTEHNNEITEYKCNSVAHLSYGV